jgi:hypothetical protein
MAVSVVVTTEGHTQKDGSRYVLEIYSDAQGEAMRIEYLAFIGADTAAIATARTPFVLEALARGEAVAALYVESAPVLRYQTGAQFLQRLREFWRNTSRETCTRIARWIIHRLDAGDVTEAQLMNVFDLTQAQWNNLEIKMRGFAADQDGVDAAAGE